MLKVFVVCTGDSEGYNPPLAAFSTKELAEQYASKGRAEAAGFDEWRIDEVELDPGIT